MDTYSNYRTGFPRQMLSDKQKTAEWRKQCVAWAASRSFLTYQPITKSCIQKRINYDLLEGKLHMPDLQLVLNPYKLDAEFIPDNIQHYPIMNSKLNVLVGEELRRPFDYRVIITNPEAITELEENKRKAVQQAITQWIQDTSVDEEEAARRLDEQGEYFEYEYQDFLELQANEYLNHFRIEQNFPLKFSKGFQDVLANAEEIYQCDIDYGEPVMVKLNPLNVHPFQSGNSSKIEDADVVIIEEYWNPSRIIDTFGEELTQKQIQMIDQMPYGNGGLVEDGMGHYDPRLAFVNRTIAGLTFDASGSDFFSSTGGYGHVASQPYDMEGNIRVLRVYWKSKRKIQKVKRYNRETGAVEFNYFTEQYVPDKMMGEESKTLWISEAWEGTLIGGNMKPIDGSGTGDTLEGGIFVRMRPRPIQYSRMSHPGKCHFGIIGQIYNMNTDKPFSLVDMMKPYNYLYDVLHYRLIDAVSSSWGSILEYDVAKRPTGWTTDKWMYFAKINHLAVIDSAKEGTGPMQGKPVGALNNAGKGIMTANDAAYMQFLMQACEYIKTEMGEIAGINRQREGQIANRETVGGVERATLQSSYITEWLFAQHDDVKKRVCECFVDTAKAAAKDKGKIKFQYMTSEKSMKTMEIDGELFAMNDYGLAVDYSGIFANINDKLEGMALAAMQNGAIELSAMMSIWSSQSIAQKRRIIQRSEKKLQERQERMQMEQIESQQQVAQMQMELEAQKQQWETQRNSENNQTKIAVAQIQAGADVDVANIRQFGNEVEDGIQPMTEKERLDFKEKLREFNKTHALEVRKVDLQERKNKEDARLKSRQISKMGRTSKK